MPENEDKDNYNPAEQRWSDDAVMRQTSGQSPDENQPQDDSTERSSGDTNHEPDTPDESNLAAREAEPSARQAAAAPADDNESSLYHDEAPKKPSKKAGLMSRTGNKMFGNTRRKITTIMAIIGIMTSMGFAGFGALAHMKLHTIVQGLHERGFARYQVAMEGRSNVWLRAYFTARLMDIAPNASASGSTTDNLLFRVENADTGNPMVDWYKKMRNPTVGLANSFESDVLEKNGIKFASVAYRDAAGNVKFRPAKVTINDTPLSFDPFNGPNAIDPAVMERAASGDINAIQELGRLSGKLDEFVTVQTFQNDKEGRKALNNVLKDELPGWRNATKRKLIRASISRSTGLRSWRFFENTRGKLEETNIAIRNKVIRFVLPDKTRFGRFMQCILGTSDCKSATDPSSPSARDGPTVNGESSPARATTDASGNPIPGSNATADAATAAVEDVAKAATREEAQALLAKTIITKLDGPAAIVSAIDTVARIDKSMAAGTLVNLVVAAKTAQAMGLFSGLATADSQLVANDNLNSQEQASLMTMLSSASRGEGWQIIAAAGGAVSGIGTPSTARDTYCSDEHQAKLQDNEYHYLCPQYQIGGSSTAGTMTAAWNTYMLPFHPLLSAYVNSPIGSIVNFINNVIGAITGPIVNVAISAIPGAKDAQTALVTFVMEHAISFLGGGPIVNGFEPGGVLLNVALEGSAAAAEAAARASGAARTNPTSQAYAIDQYVAYNENQQATSSLYDRYLSLDNSNSFASKQVMASMNLSIGSSLAKLTDFSSLFSSSLGNIASFTHTTKAAALDPYAASKFAGIDTYDFPAQCSARNPLTDSPQDATNAAALGIIPGNELTWDVVKDSDKFYSLLYEKLGEGPDAEAKAKQVYNCELLDNGARISVGAKYGYHGTGEYGSDSPGTTSSSTTGSNQATSNGCTATSVVAPCLGGASTAATGWGTPVFDDEFNGTTLDKTKWNDNPGWRINNTTTNPSNVSVSGGNLVLRLASASDGAAVDTKPNGTTKGIEITNGYYAEARIAFPGSGSKIYNWPAWWTTSYNWPATGEYDIAEGLDGMTTNYHSPNTQMSGTVPGNWSNDFHTYGLDRENGISTIYWDGKEIQKFNANDGGAPQYFIINVGYNSSYTTITGPGSDVKVDYVRVWKK